MVAGDFDLDGSTDLVVGHTGTVTWFAGKGDGSFGTSIDTRLNPSPRTLVVGELNGDARPDLGVVADGGTVLPLQNLGRGEFREVLIDVFPGQIGALPPLHRELPVELGGHSRDKVIFDFEIKVNAAGSLAVKQVRPFLLADPGPPGPVFELEVPVGTAVCGLFVDGREPRAEYQVKSQVKLRAGPHPPPTGSPSFPGSLIEEVIFGPDRQVAVPLVPGRFDVETRAEGNGNATYTFAYRETFKLPGGEELSVEVSFLAFDVRRGIEPRRVKFLDEAFITDGLVMLAVPGGDRIRIVRYSSCQYETLPRWEGKVELEGGDLVTFEERFRVPLAGSGPAALVGASVHLGGIVQEVRDYWRLVYAAQHHNERVRYWIVLDPPLDVGGAGPVSVVELNEPQVDRGLEAQVSYLAMDHRPLARPAVLCWQKAPEGQLGSCGFRRGDVDGSSTVNISDAIQILLHLYRGGPGSRCEDAGDFNDDGVMDVTDVVIILTFLFRGVDLSAPPGPFECGPDATPDFLGACRDESCGR